VSTKSFWSSATASLKGSGRLVRIRWLLPLAAVAVALAAATFVAEAAGRARLVSPTPTPILYDRTGTFLGQIGPARGDGSETRREYGYWTVPTVPERVVRATLALEDRRFWSHPGVDPLALARAAWQNLRSGRRISGASTIAMQIARMQNPQPRTLWSKAVEAGTAMALTARYGRAALLAHYLRLVPYGNGSHGIGHAARWYFEKPVDDLSWAEIALLAAIPQSPSLMNPRHRDGLARALRRGHAVLDELERRGVLDGVEARLAHAQLAAMPPPPRRRRPDALHPVLQLEARLRAGDGPRLDGADPRLRVSLDLRVQELASTLARRFLAAWRGGGAEQVAVLVVERGTRAVLASIGSSGYGGRRGGAIDFTRVLRSPGSTLKPFVYALALDKGLIRPSDVMADLPEGAAGIGNADGHFLGPLLPRQALANSRNVPAAMLLRDLGLETAFGALRDFGLHDLDTPAERFGLSMAIGSLPTSLERLVTAYGALAEDGVLADLVWYPGQRRSEPQRLLSIDAARLVTLFLADASARLPSFPRYGPTEFPFPVALKTGTSQGYRDAWTLAWSGRFIVGVWVGRGDAGPMAQLSGAGSAARLAHALMLRLHGTPIGDLSEIGFPPPQGRVPVELCVFGGRRSRTCSQTLTEWVKPDEVLPLEEAPVARDAARSRRMEAIPTAHPAWARTEGYPLAEGPTLDYPEGAARLTIKAPEQDSRIWRNPELPDALNRVALKANVSTRAEQIVWYVDGEPFSIAEPDKPVFWPLRPGTHHIQVRLPYRDGASRPVRIVVE
jgi:penicillin-binding protein 1C